MKVLIGKQNVSNFSSEMNNVLFKNDVLAISKENSDMTKEYSLKNHKKLIISGNLFYVLKDDAPLKLENNSAAEEVLIENFSALEVDEARLLLEGHYTGVLYDENGNAEIFSDKFGREDIYYIKNEDGIIVSTKLEPIIGLRKEAGFDQVSLINFFNVYGTFAPKKDTFYAGIKRIAVGERISCIAGNGEIKQLPFKPENTQDFGDKELETYFEYLKSAVETRSTTKGVNWIYMSSGWDSSSILAMLRHLYDADKIRCTIGRFKYSSKTGINNNFEIERAQKLCDYFGVKLDVVDMDYTKEDYLDYISSIAPKMRSQQLYTFAGYNFFKLAEHIKENGSADDVVFNGEMSDGCHNMGFSQYATILSHRDLGFREYSDKMASYLYGSKFFSAIKENDHSDDLIYKLIQEQKGVEIADKKEGETDEEWKRRYIASFMLSSARVPFAGIHNTSFTTEYGRESYKKHMDEEYFDDFAKHAEPENLYSWFLHMYNSFHWQGSTVGVTLKSPGNYSRAVASPYWDTRVMDFLEKMPEEMGRGLDIKPTKYPIKWVLNNKIDYPTHLQTGPHSYIYDVDPSWSAEGDILYGSYGVDHFKKLLKERKYKEILNPEFFDFEKIDQLADGYIEGKEYTGQNRSDLARLVTLCLFGWY